MSTHDHESPLKESTIPEALVWTISVLSIAVLLCVGAYYSFKLLDLLKRKIQKSDAPPATLPITIPQPPPTDPNARAELELLPPVVLESPRSSTERLRQLCHVSMLNRKIGADQTKREEEELESLKKEREAALEALDELVEELEEKVNQSIEVESPTAATAPTQTRARI